MLFRPALLAAAFAAVVALAACGDRPATDAPPADAAAPRADASGPLVVYAGRREVLVGPLVERFRAATGIDVQVRYGSDAELLAALAEEGAASRASLFWANTAGALGAARTQGLLSAAPDSLLARPAGFVPSGGAWVPVTVRFRVLAYAPDRVDAASLPARALDLPAQAALAGRIGWTPTYSSFQDFVTALRVVHGEAAAREWLDGVRALRAKAYPSNGPMLEALAAGEIDVALTNHYYVMRAQADDAHAGRAPRLAIHHFETGDVGNLALVTGAGILARAPHPTAAARFLSFLLTPEAQAFAATEVQEVPVMAGAPAPAGFLAPDAARALSPALDFERLADLDATLALMRAAGLL